MKMKKALGHEAGITGIVHKADWLKAKEAEPDRPKKFKSGYKKLKQPRKFPKELAIQIVKEKAGGATEAYLVQKYGVSKTYIQDALSKHFVTSAVGREVLKNVVLENGIAAGMRVHQTIKDLTPVQSVMATGLMAKTFIDLDKHTAATPVEIDFSELQKIGDNLKEISEAIGVTDDGDGEDFIDV